MKNPASENTTQIRVVKLFETNPLLVAVHFLAAAALIYIAQPLVKTEQLYNWGAGFITALLLGQLVQSMFNRMKKSTNHNYAKWENFHGLSQILIGLVFSVGYCYVAFLGDTTLIATITTIMVMHLSCLIVACLNSKKTIFSIVLPMVVSFIATLFYFSLPQALLFIVGLAVYASVFLALSINVSRTLKSSVENTVKLQNQVELNEQHRLKLESNSFIDFEKNIYNRRFFDLMIDEKIRRAKRVGNNLSLAIIEIDFFSEYTAHYGAEKALQCLQKIAKILSNATHRGGEYMTCFDTNKFALIASNVPTKEAVAFTKKMTQLIDGADITHRTSRVENSQKVTLSIGVSEFKPGNIIDVDEIIGQALFALETAHTLGHNNIQVFESDHNTPTDNKSDYHGSTKPYLVSDHSRSA